VSPLISARTNEEWDLSVRVVLERAITLSQKEVVTVEERARIALEAVSHLWLGWELDLIIRSCRASLEAGTPVIVGRSEKNQAKEYLKKVDNDREAYLENVDLVPGEGSSAIKPPELLMPEGLEELLEAVRQE
jgi:hypothetical protein